MTSNPRVAAPRSVCLRLAVLPLAAWAGCALAFQLPGPAWVGIGLGVLLPLSAWVLTWVLPPKAGWSIFALGFLVVLGFFLAQRPSQDRVWMPDVARLARAEVSGSRLVMRNVRHCRYASEQDAEIRFEDRAYDLDRLRGMDLFLVSWGPRHIAHTILSFEFEGGEHLAFSIETRKEAHETYSALRGFFRQYELCIVAGDERDLILLRTNHRREQVRLYRLNTPPDRARAILLDYVARINRLAAQPEWYNALTDNCTTAMDREVRNHSNRLPWSWKLVASGHLDEHLYAHGLISRSLPFPELRERALINSAALAIGDDPAFSAKIREACPKP